MLCLNESYSYVWLVMRWGLPSSGHSVRTSQPVSVTNGVCSNCAEHRPSWGGEGGRKGTVNTETWPHLMTGCQLTRYCMYTLHKITPNPPCKSIHIYCIRVYRTCFIKCRENQTSLPEVLEHGTCYTPVNLHMHCYNYILMGKPAYVSITECTQYIHT